MNRTADLTLLIFLSSACIAAQTNSNTNRGFAILAPSAESGSAASGGQIPNMPLRVTIPAVSGCPVAMSARQSGGGDLIKVAPGRQPQSGLAPAQQIHLGFTGGNSASILEATVRAHGLTPRTRTLQAELVTIGPSEITRTLHLNFAGETASVRDAELVLRGFTSVSYIDLVSLTYADGSEWTPGERVCRVTPDALMLIGAR
jgi:hypothetical protein